jgi:flagellar motility protein MotE (MotC chaperone)
MTQLAPKTLAGLPAPRCRWLSAVVVVGVAWAPAVMAGDPDRQVAIPSDPAERAVQMYCTNMRDKVLDARFEWQRRQLQELDGSVAAQIRKLEAQIAEHRKWYDLRKAFAGRARDTLVAVLARMRPDAAASQLANMDAMTASAIILRLNADQSSKILNEMDPVKAAELSSIIADSARPGRGGNGS